MIEMFMGIYRAIGVIGLNYLIRLSKFIHVSSDADLHVDLIYIQKEGRK